MPISLPLKEMTLHEKLAAMEALWEELSRTADAVESPSWHKQVLDEREQRVSEGKARFVGWEKAKEDIRRKLS